MTSCFRKQYNDAQCKGIKDSGSHCVDFGLKYLSVELGFWIQNVSGIPDSTSKIFPDLKFHKEKFPGFLNLDSITWGDLMLHSKIYLKTD